MSKGMESLSAGRRRLLATMPTLLEIIHMLLFSSFTMSLVSNFRTLDF